MAKLVKMLLSWSLTIEEWFYLLFGLLLIGSALIVPARTAILLSLIAFITVPLALRIFYHPFVDPSLGLQHSVVFKLDQIACGVAVAALYSAHSRLLNWPGLSLAVGAGPITLAFMIVTGAISGRDFFGQIVIYNIFAVGTAFCLPAALALPFGMLPQWLEQAISTVARQSYCLYIVHLTILVDFTQTLWIRKTVSTPVAIALAPGLSFVIASLSYRYFERPILARRPQQQFGERRSTKVGKIR